MNIQSQQKHATANALHAHLSAAELALVVNFQGCTCEQLTGLRRNLKAKGANISVMKNTLARLLAQFPSPPVPPIC